MRLLFGKKGILDVLYEVVFLVIIMFIIGGLFILGQFSKKISIEDSVNQKVNGVNADYLLVQYLRMPVDCDGKKISVLDCWDKISLNDDVGTSCGKLLEEPTKTFFKSAGFSDYVLHFLQKKKILCTVGTAKGSRTFVAMEIALPSPDPKNSYSVSGTLGIQ